MIGFHRGGRLRQDRCARAPTVAKWREPHRDDVCEAEQVFPIRTGSAPLPFTSRSRRASRRRIGAYLQYAPGRVRGPQSVPCQAPQSRMSGPIFPGSVYPGRRMAFGPGNSPLAKRHVAARVIGPLGAAKVEVEVEVFGAAVPVPTIFKFLDRDGTYRASRRQALIGCREIADRATNADGQRQNADPRGGRVPKNLLDVVLVVNGDPLVLLAAADMIEEAPYHVRQSGNADEAMVLLTRPGHPDHLDRYREARNHGRRETGCLRSRALAARRNHCHIGLHSRQRYRLADRQPVSSQTLSSARVDRLSR